LDPPGRAAGRRCGRADAAAGDRVDRRALRRPADGVRRGILIGVVAVLAVVAATAATVTVMSRDRRVPLVVRPTPSLVPPTQLASGPVRAPSSGALLGAWVRPDSLTQT